MISTPLFTHLKKVVQALRAINRLGIQAKTREELLGKACRSLVDSGGYAAAWILTLNEEKAVEDCFLAGETKEKKVFFPALRKECWKKCVHKTVSSTAARILEPEEGECLRCLFTTKKAEQSILTCRIAHKEKTYGVLLATVDRMWSHDREERSTLTTIGEDIGWALSSWNAQNDFNKDVSALKKSEETLQALNRQLEAGERQLNIVNDELLRRRKEAEKKNTELAEALGKSERQRKAHLVLMGDLKQTSQKLREEIEERKNTEAALRVSEQRFRQVYEHMEMGIAHVTLDFQILHANHAYCRMLEYKEEQLKGKHLKDLTHPEVIEDNLRMQRELAAGKIDHYRMEKKFITRTGKIVNGILDANLIRGEDGKPEYFLGSVLDISQRIKAEAQIQQDLKERDLLIRELYHRTKNNMQVIISLIRMKCLLAEKSELTEVFQEIQQKIQSMALVHKMLYRGKDLSHIDLKSYILEFISNSLGSLGAADIGVETDMDSVSVSIDTAIPLGMVLAELMINTVKHAFPEGLTKDAPKITIVLRSVDGILDLVYHDNGCGISPGIDLRDSGSMGMQTLFGIIEQQLQGDISYRSSNGLSWCITLDDRIHKERLPQVETE